MHYLNFYFILILFANFVANSSVKLGPFKFGRSVFDYQKLEKVDNQNEEMIELLKKEAEDVQNTEKFENEALPLIAIISDKDKVKIYIKEIKAINKLDGQISKFFTSDLNFEKFMNHFNERYQTMKNGSEKELPTMVKEKFEVFLRII
ncbi:unnamed protein product [Meloidogyne enterolobii]|uniref:Uncharacterized protein n=1 Tax=Meloidogyne enterolobii TaxID=390850 RepID=A0ACB1B6H5_MELEN